MNENIIKTICSEMNRYLNNYQMSKLNETLYKRLDSNDNEISNNEYLNKFISSKKLEGCSDINFENKSCIVFGKGRKMREVYFDGKTKVHLQEYLNSRIDENKALFVSLYMPYKRISYRGIETMLKRLGKEIGIYKVHPHKFRRTLVTRAIDKGMPIEQVQHLLGHTRIDTTLHYAMVNPNNVKISHRKYIC